MRHHAYVILFLAALEPPTPNARGIAFGTEVVRGRYCV
jgi:hypothetical protein